MVSGSFRDKTLHTHVQMVKELSSAQTWSYSVKILHTLVQYLVLLKHVIPSSKWLPGLVILKRSILLSKWLAVLVVLKCCVLSTKCFAGLVVRKRIFFPNR